VARRVDRQIVELGPFVIERTHVHGVISVEKEERERQERNVSD
jgi:hypothetical protein